MTHRPDLDVELVAWIRSGPETAAPEFVERTLRPVPRMRQRRSWRIAVDRWLAAPAAVATGAAVVVVVGLGAIILAGLPGRDGVGAPSPTAGLRPSFELLLDARTYRSDPAASVATCLGEDDGSWSVLYAGGDPFLSLDLVVGTGAGAPGRDDAVGAEIQTAGQYVRFDPAVLRGGDPPGRSEASIEVTTVGDATMFVVAASTPQRITGADGPPVAVELTLTCRPASQEVTP
jgi:hypothetical protein